MSRPVPFIPRDGMGRDGIFKNGWDFTYPDGRTDGWMDGRTDGWTDGRTDGRMGGRTDGTRMNLQTKIGFYSCDNASKNHLQTISLNADTQY